MMLGNWSKQVAVGPSMSPDYTEAPKEMDARDIAEMIDYHVRCARNAVDGGFDGIEIQSAHGYLLHQFLSPKFNFRTDSYGGSLENRMRFGVEVVGAVREEVGDKVAVGIRLAGDDEQTHEPGLTADDAAEVAARYEELGLVDFLNVSVGIGGIGMVRTNYAPHCSASTPRTPSRRPCATRRCSPSTASSRQRRPTASSNATRPTASRSCARSSRIPSG